MSRDPFVNRLWLCLPVALQHKLIPPKMHFSQVEMYPVSAGLALQDELGSGGNQEIFPELACVQDADR